MIATCSVLPSADLFRPKTDNFQTKWHTQTCKKKKVIWSSIRTIKVIYTPYLFAWHNQLKHKNVYDWNVSHHNNHYKSHLDIPIRILCVIQNAAYGTNIFNAGYKKINVKAYLLCGFLGYSGRFGNNHWFFIIFIFFTPQSKLDVYPAMLSDAKRSVWGQ